MVVDRKSRLMTAPLRGVRTASHSARECKRCRRLVRCDGCCRASGRTRGACSRAFVCLLQRRDRARLPAVRASAARRGVRFGRRRSAQQDRARIARSVRDSGGPQLRAGLSADVDVGASDRAAEKGSVRASGSPVARILYGAENRRAHQPAFGRHDGAADGRQLQPLGVRAAVAVPDRRHRPADADGSSASPRRRWR